MDIKCPLCEKTMWHDDVAYMKYECERLRAEAESLRKDAERYRWLRDTQTVENDEGEKTVSFWCGFEHYDNVDAAIDEAMARGP